MRQFFSPAVVVERLDVFEASLVVVEDVVDPPHHFWLLVVFQINAIFRLH